MIPSMDELAPYVDNQECHEIAPMVEKQWPHLKAHGGFYVNPTSKLPGDHSWNEAPDGTIVDTTASQHEPNHSIIIPPDHPYYPRYVSYTKDFERATDLAAQQYGMTPEEYRTYQGIESKTAAEPRYYHSTQAELKPGDIIQPASQLDQPEGWGAAYDPNYVYIFDQRHLEHPDYDPVYPNAFDHTYEVEPLGPVEQDPEGEELRKRYEQRHGHPFSEPWYDNLVPGCEECARDDEQGDDGIPEWYHPYSWRTTHARVVGDVPEWSQGGRAERLRQFGIDDPRISKTSERHYSPILLSDSGVRDSSVSVDLPSIPSPLSSLSHARLEHLPSPLVDNAHKHTHVTNTHMNTMSSLFPPTLMNWYRARQESRETEQGGANKAEDINGVHNYLFDRGALRNPTSPLKEATTPPTPTPVQNRSPNGNPRLGSGGYPDDSDFGDSPYGEADLRTVGPDLRQTPLTDLRTPMCRYCGRKPATHDEACESCYLDLTRTAMTKEALGVNDLPPEDRALYDTFRTFIHPRNKLFPWLMKRYKQGDITFGDEEWFKRQNFDPYVRALEDGDPEDIDYTKRKLLSTNPSYYLYAPDFEKHPALGEDGMHDMDEVLPIIKQWHQQNRNKPDFNLNSFNMKGVANNINQQMVERAKNYGKVVHTLPNNWTIRKIQNAEEASHEGNMMSNCIGDYGEGIENGNDHIWSLRDEKNRPHASVELSPRLNLTDEQIKDAGLWRWMKEQRFDRTDIRNYLQEYALSGEKGWSWRALHPRIRDKLKQLDATLPRQWETNQIFAKGNTDPKGAYKAMIKHWFDTFEPKVRAGTSHYIKHLDEISDEPRMDEYGALQTVRPHWNYLTKSVYQPDLENDNQTVYDPKRIQRYINYVRSNDEDPSGYISNLVEPHLETINMLRQEGATGALQGLQNSPTLQTLSDLQREFPVSADQMLRLSGVKKRTPVLHINDWGEPCTCPWGDKRARGASAARIEPLEAGTPGAPTQLPLPEPHSSATDFSQMLAPGVACPRCGSHETVMVNADEMRCNHCRATSPLPNLFNMLPPEQVNPFYNDEFFHSRVSVEGDENTDSDVEQVQSQRDGNRVPADDLRQWPTDHDDPGDVDYDLDDEERHFASGVAGVDRARTREGIELVHRLARLGLLPGREEEDHEDEPFEQT